MKNLKKQKGFTLIELLVCGVLMSVATVGVVNLIQLSEASAMRGRLDARAGTTFRDIVDSVSSVPMQEFRNIVLNATDVNPVSGEAVFYLGTGEGQFPFVSGENTTASRYLMEGKPIPGQTAPMGNYPYRVEVRVGVPNGGTPSGTWRFGSETVDVVSMGDAEDPVPVGVDASTTPYFDVTVTLSWDGYRDKMSESGVMQTTTRSVRLKFRKWDPANS